MLLAQSSTWYGTPYTDQMLSTEDSKIKKFEMTLGTEFNTISTCALLHKWY